jgi:hypothetical protein
VVLGQQGKRSLLRVTTKGRWLIRTIAAVFDPSSASRPAAPG